MLIRASGHRDWRYFFQPDLKILLNGEEVTHTSTVVVEADNEAGYLIRYCLDDAGRLIEDGNRYKTERVEGIVVFTGTRKLSPDDAKAAAQAKRDRRQIRNIAVVRRGAAGTEVGT